MNRVHANKSSYTQKRRPAARASLLGHSIEHVLVRPRSTTATIDMLNAHLVSAPEALPIVVPQVTRHIRMAKLIAIVHIRRPMILEVLAGALDAIMKSAALDILKLPWRRLPRLRWTFLIPRRRRWRPLCECSGYPQRCYRQTQTKKCCHRSRASLHIDLLACVLATLRLAQERSFHAQCYSMGIASQSLL